MNIRTILVSAAVAGLLAASGSAQAQLLGGGAGGSLGGSVAGGLGNVGGQAAGTLNGSVRGSTDAIGRTRDLGSSAAVAAEGVARDAEAAQPKASKAKPRKAKRPAGEAPAKADRAPAEKPQPKAQAGGKASGNNSLSASGDPAAASQADAGLDFDASVEQ